jgi:ABC-type Zn uptake system ZnuABC Zn-binding protein ZnuA
MPLGRLLCLLIALCVGSSYSLASDAAGAEEPLPVVVTIPVLKDFVDQIGGTHVRVTSLLNGYENEHTYAPKPSDLVAVRKARLLFEVGIGLEVWVSSLVKSAGSPSLTLVTTSKGIGLIRDVPNEEDSTGQKSPGGGNPHVWLDPENAATMMRHIAEALIKAAPSHAEDFRNNQAAYLRQLDQLRADLHDRLRGVPDRRIVAHHPAWPYFARRFGFEISGIIQTQSGSEPSAKRLQNLITTMKKAGIKVIVSEIQLSQRIPDLLAKETGAKVVVLTTLTGGLPHTQTYLDMLRYNVLQLANALESA